MDRLARQREGAGNDGLGGDDRGAGGQDDHRQQRPFREHQVEGIGHRLGMLEDESPLSQIIERECRKDEADPGHWMGLRPKWPRSA